MRPRENPSFSCVYAAFGINRVPKSVSGGLSRRGPIPVNRRATSKMTSVTKTEHIPSIAVCETNLANVFLSTRLSY
ncbi:hypothetical protein R80B4_02490 [Fibrobacteres bacterium R8-0-B4]